MLQSYYALADHIHQPKSLRDEDMQKWMDKLKDPFDEENATKLALPPSAFITAEKRIYIDRVKRTATDENDEAQLEILKKIELDLAIGPNGEILEEDIKKKFFAEWIRFLTGRIEENQLEFHVIKETPGLVVKAEESYRTRNKTEGWNIRKQPPAGRVDVHGDEIRKYLSRFTKRHFGFIKKIFKLKFEGPKTLEDHWLFFKYIVKGAANLESLGSIPDIFTSYDDFDLPAGFQDKYGFDNPPNDPLSLPPGFGPAHTDNFGAIPKKQQGIGGKINPFLTQYETHEEMMEDAIGISMLYKYYKEWETHKYRNIDVYLMRNRNSAKSRWTHLNESRNRYRNLEGLIAARERRRNALRGVEEDEIEWRPFWEQERAGGAGIDRRRRRRRRRRGDDGGEGSDGDDPGRGRGGRGRGGRGRGGRGRGGRGRGGGGGAEEEEEREEIAEEEMGEVVEEEREEIAEEEMGEVVEEEREEWKRVGFEDDPDWDVVGRFGEPGRLVDEDWDPLEAVPAAPVPATGEELQRIAEQWEQDLELSIRDDDEYQQTETAHVYDTYARTEFSKILAQFNDELMANYLKLPDPGKKIWQEIAPKLEWGRFHEIYVRFSKNEIGQEEFINLVSDVTEQTLQLREISAFIRNVKEHVVNAHYMGERDKYLSAISSKLEEYLYGSKIIQLRNWRKEMFDRTNARLEQLELENRINDLTEFAHQEVEFKTNLKTNLQKFFSKNWTNFSDTEKKELTMFFELNEMRKVREDLPDQQLNLGLQKIHSMMQERHAFATHYSEQLKQKNEEYENLKKQLEAYKKSVGSDSAAAHKTITELEERVRSLQISLAAAQEGSEQRGIMLADAQKRHAALEAENKLMTDFLLKLGVSEKIWRDRSKDAAERAKQLEGVVAVYRNNLAERERQVAEIAGLNTQLQQLSKSVMNIAGEFNNAILSGIRDGANAAMASIPRWREFNPGSVVSLVSQGKMAYDIYLKWLKEPAMIQELARLTSIDSRQLWTEFYRNPMNKMVKNMLLIANGVQFRDSLSIVFPVLMANLVNKSGGIENFKTRVVPQGPEGIINALKTAFNFANTTAIEAGGSHRNISYKTVLSFTRALAIAAGDTVEDYDLNTERLLGSYDEQEERGKNFLNSLEFLARHLQFIWSQEIRHEDWLRYRALTFQYLQAHAGDDISTHVFNTMDTILKDDASIGNLTGDELLNWNRSFEQLLHVYIQEQFNDMIEEAIGLSKHAPLAIEGPEAAPRTLTGHMDAEPADIRRLTGPANLPLLAYQAEVEAVAEQVVKIQPERGDRPNYIVVNSAHQAVTPTGIESPERALVLRDASRMALTRAVSPLLQAVDDQRATLYMNYNQQSLLALMRRVANDESHLTQSESFVRSYANYHSGDFDDLVLMRIFQFVQRSSSKQLKRISAGPGVGNALTFEPIDAEIQGEIVPRTNLLEYKPELETVNLMGKSEIAQFKIDPEADRQNQLLILQMNNSTITDFFRPEAPPQREYLMDVREPFANERSRTQYAQRRVRALRIDAIQREYSKMLRQIELNGSSDIGHKWHAASGINDTTLNQLMAETGIAEGQLFNNHPFLNEVFIADVNDYNQVYRQLNPRQINAIQGLNAVAIHLAQTKVAENVEQGLAMALDRSWPELDPARIRLGRSENPILGPVFRPSTGNHFGGAVLQHLANLRSNRPRP